MENIKRFAWVNHSTNPDINEINGDTLIRAENSTNWVKLGEIHGAKGRVPAQKDQLSDIGEPIEDKGEYSTESIESPGLFESFLSKFKNVAHQQEQYQAPEQQRHNQLVTPSTTSWDDWIFKPKSISAFKWFLSANPWKSYQLDLAQRKGDMVTIAVRSGKRLNLRIGTFKVKISKNRKTQGIRDFHVKTIKGIKPRQKITFRESQWQMPEEDWDQLSQNLEASDMAISKIANSALNILEKVKKNI